MADKVYRNQLAKGWLDSESKDRLPSEPGAYGLLIRLPRRFSGQVGALGPVELTRGTYLYLGSAYGPGGLSARICRHLRPDKKPHWHVDRLTAEGQIYRLFALSHACECDLVDCALDLPGTHVPIIGFGSSDCRRCDAHLFEIEDNPERLFRVFSALC